MVRTDQLRGTPIVVEVPEDTPGGVLDDVFAWFRYVDETRSADEETSVQTAAAILDAGGVRDYSIGVGDTTIVRGRP
jgi:hypothetical protein